MRYLIVFFSLLFSFTARAGDDIDKSLPAAKDGKVVIKVVSGDVTVESWNKSEVRVVGEIDDSEERFIFKSSDDKTLIEVKGKEKNYGHSWGSDSTDITVYIPSKSAVEAGGMSTDFNFSNVLGGIRAKSVSGDIDLTDVEGSLKIETVSGDVSIANGRGKKMNLSTVSGDIETAGEASQYSVNTVSGDVEAKLGEVEVIDFSSVSGDLDLRFKFADNGEIEARTVSGDLRFSFENAPVNARFELETGPGGDIENDLTDDRSDKSFIGSERLSFSSGNGKGSVQIETMSGTIDLDD